MFYIIRSKMNITTSDEQIRNMLYEYQSTNRVIAHISIYKSPGLIIYNHRDVKDISSIVDSFNYSMIDLFNERIIASFDTIPIIYPQDTYQISFNHEGADFFEILNQFEYSRDISLLRQLSIYDLIDFLEQDILTEKEYITFLSHLTAIEIVSILKLILPELDTFLHEINIDDLINELDPSITYQEVLSHFITKKVLNTYHQYKKKKILFRIFLSSTCSCIMCRIISTI